MISTNKLSLVSWLVVVFITILLLYWGKYLFMPLSLATFVAIFLTPFARFFESFRLPRAVSAFIPVIILLLFVAGFIFFFKSQLKTILEDLPLLKLRLKDLLADTQLWIQAHYKIDVAAQTNFISKQVNNLIDSSSAGLGALLKFLILFTLFMFFTFYILLYRRMLTRFMLSFFSKKDQQEFGDFNLSLHYTINNYVKGLIIEMIVVITLGFIAVLIIGIKYALLMAVIAGLFNLIPYLGIYAAALLNAVIAMMTGSSHQAFIILIVYAVIHIVDANLLIPFIVGNRIKINPFITLIAVVVGELIWGIPGMFLFIPITGVFKIIVEKTSDFKPFSIILGNEQ